MHTSFESLADGVVVMSVRRDVDVLFAAAFTQQTPACLECGVRCLIIDTTGSDLVGSTGAWCPASRAGRGGAASRWCAATPRSGPPHAQRRPSL